MDIVKIGKFISLCRKEIGLTQKELGEKLGVSDKSVSKWERGINLPDVSLYYPLCDVLGISIHELFVGERIKEEELVHKSEENILTVIKDNNKISKRLLMIEKVIKIAAICLVPLIILQWNLKLVWVSVDMGL